MTLPGYVVERLEVLAARKQVSIDTLMDRRPTQAAAAVSGVGGLDRVASTASDACRGARQPFVRIECGLFELPTITVMPVSHPSFVHETWGAVGRRR